MRGNEQVIAQLNLALREELSAINQYFLHAEMLHSWGYHRIGAYVKKQSIDEMKHAEKLIERLLFLDATPKMEYLDLNVGGNVKAQLESGDLDLAFRVPPSEFDRLSAVESLEVISAANPGIVRIVFATEKAPSHWIRAP